MKDIEKIEKFVLYGYDSKLDLKGEHTTPMPHIKKVSIKTNTLLYGLLFCLLSAILFLMAYRWLGRIEHMVNVYHFYMFLAFIPAVAALTIKINNRTINRGRNIESPQSHLMWLIPGLGLWFIRSIFSQEMFDTLTFFAFAATGLFLVWGACTSFYRVYLIHKYEPYFKDRRIRRLAE